MSTCLYVKCTLCAYAHLAQDQITAMPNRPLNGLPCDIWVNFADQIRVSLGTDVMQAV